MNKDTVFSGYPLYLSNIPTNGKARVCSRIVENSSRPERCKHLAEVGCSAWWFPAYVGVFLLVGMIGFSLHIGWIEDALFSFGHPYFGTVFFRRGALLFVWSTAVNRTVKIGWTVYEVLALAGIPLLLVFHTWAMQRYAHDPDPGAVQNLTNLLNQSYLLAVNALSFVVLLIGTICRQRNRSAEAAGAE